MCCHVSNIFNLTCFKWQSVMSSLHCLFNRLSCSGNQLAYLYLNTLSGYISFNLLLIKVLVTQWFLALDTHQNHLRNVQKILMPGYHPRSITNLQPGCQGIYIQTQPPVFKISSFSPSTPSRCCLLFLSLKCYFHIIFNFLILNL